MNATSPIITKMQVIPVAGYDSMLMTLSGAHAPCFTRNLVILTDNAGHTGIGEIHGGDYTCECLNAVKPLVEGQPVACCRQVLQRIHKLAQRAEGDDGEGIQTLDISKLKFVVKSEWAIECAMMDLMGQFLGVPMCQLLGEGQQRTEVEMLGYMFYVSDKNKYTAPGIQYLDESNSSDPWFRLRREEILTPERMVEEAQVCTRSTASTTSSSRAACCGAKRRWRRCGPSRRHSRKPASTLTPTAPGAWRRPSACAGTCAM